MKKIFKIFLFSLFILTLLSLFNNVEANSIDNISMEIYINSNGDATVTEIWNCYTSEGTEAYHPYYNLGNSTIKNLTVSEGSTKYITLSSWNTSGTLNSKAYKCGIKHISNGVELCWGISKHGRHTYTVQYTITNFVSELTDSQMIYWTLIPYDFSSSIGDVSIKIYSNFNITDTTKVWGYGNSGTVSIQNGYIKMQSDGKLPTSDYMTILVKFPKGTFNTKNKLNYDFQYYYYMAENDTTGEHTWDEFLFGYGFIFLIIFPFVAFRPKYDYGIKGNLSNKEVPYVRTIPNNDIFRSYYIGFKYKIIKNKTDILGAIILKWLKDSLISIEQKEKNSIFSKENTIIILNKTKPEYFKDKRECELFSMLYEASKDGILENKEFENWCTKSYLKILSWFDMIIDSNEKMFINEGDILFKKQKRFIFFSRKTYKFMPKLIQEALDLAGLKRYLLDYTLIKDREAIEVHLFEEYLIYAQLMGIAKKVSKQFKDIYPEIIEQSCFTSYDNIMFVHACASSGISHANSAQSSSRGGSGSFGGGGGGGGFR